MNPRDVTDMDIQALVDGQTDRERTVDLMGIIAANPALYTRYQSYQQQKKLLKMWWKDN